MDDPRLDCAILRPMESDGDHFLAYYLTEDDDTAVRFKIERSQLPINEASEEEVCDHIVLVPSALTFDFTDGIPLHQGLRGCQSGAGSSE